MPRSAPFAARVDERFAGALAAGLGRDVEVVHDRDARGPQRRPRPVQRREAERRPALAAARDELQAVPLAVLEQRAAEREQRVGPGGRAVEVAVGDHQREQVGEIALADLGDAQLGQVVIPVNCPPVTLRTWPWM